MLTKQVFYLESFFFFLVSLKTTTQKSALVREHDILALHVTSNVFSPVNKAETTRVASSRYFAALEKDTLHLKASKKN